MKTFIFKVILKEEKDGRWSASVPALPGCSSWGYSRQEPLGNIKDAAEIYIEDVVETGEDIPLATDDEMKVMDEPAVAVSLHRKRRYSKSVQTLRYSQ